MAETAQAQLRISEVVLASPSPARNPRRRSVHCTAWMSRFLPWVFLHPSKQRAATALVAQDHLQGTGEMLICRLPLMTALVILRLYVF